MLGRLNHVAIAVPDLGAAASVYAETLGAEVSAPQPLPEHGVTVVFVAVPNTKIELLEPLGKDSPIARFLEKNPAGGMHHLCYEVEDSGAAPRTACWPSAPECSVMVNRRRMVSPCCSATKDFSGTLIELEQV